MNNSIIKYTPVLLANKKAYESGQYRVISNEGSTRSSKSYSLTQLLALYIPYIEKKSITICSPSLPHLKRGVRRDFLNILQEAGVYKEKMHNKTDNIYNYPNGSYVEFFGVEDKGKVHGPSRDILYCNELNLFSQETYTQLAIRTNETIFADYNPADEYSFVYQIADKEGNKKIHSTYKNNLGNLTPEIIAEIESLKDADENLWKVYGLGLRGTSSESIYTHWQTIEQFPQCEQVFYGLDFGYNNPSALVKCGVRDKKMYVEEMFYETKLTTNDLAEIIKIYGLTRSCEIFCDAAEPKTIEELKRMGLNAKPADKSVYDGIQLVKSMPLYITTGSVNMIKEIKSYKWKVDKDGKVMDEPVKFMDHACFVGDTMVLTSQDEKKISEIKPNEKVLTSEGLKTVLFHHDNGLKRVHKYLMQFDTFNVSLECTPDHLVKTDKGWKKISELQQGQMISLSNSLMVNHSNCNPAKDTSTTTRKECTSMFGSIITERFLSDSIYITKMATHGIIDPTTLNSKRRINICHTMAKNYLKTKDLKKDFTKLELKLLRNGTSRKRGENGIVCMERIHGRIGNIKSCYANNAEKNIKHATVARNQNFVILTAKLKHLERGEGSLKRVYDLTVEDAHEYFANGVLVHNCDAMRYAIFTKLAKSKKKLLY
jgi:phage terminase large subunit